MADARRFPDGFLWGAATSAYQIEGSPLADGAGPSNWHVFSHTPGRTHAGDTGDVACDHYRRWEQDVDLMGDLGLGAYRFSIAWSRVLPEGRGLASGRGLGFYSRLVDRLLARNIRPVVTLYHWDHPATLDAEGGWANPDSPRWFADYADLVFHALGDRVAMWATLNEPWVVVDAGHLHGVHAPGHRDLAESARVMHHLLLAHGDAVVCARSRGIASIGLVVNLEPKDAASDRPEDRAAAARSDVTMNRPYLDAALLGRYPEELPSLYGPAWPETTEEEMGRIRQPLDFVGINYYTRGVMAHDDSVPLTRARHVKTPGALRTETDWEVHPASFTRVLRDVTDRYGRIPLYVTENGAAFADPEHVEESTLDDPLRVRYLRDHLGAAREAIRHGVDLRGYFVWSLLDNFEWSAGYSKRFGIHHVDFESQKRTPKASARFYRDVLHSNGTVLDDSVSEANGERSR